jgi:hypothetical protein
METEISSRTVIKCKVKVVRRLESEVKVNDELMIGLLENIGLDDSVLQLFLEDQVLLLERFQGIEMVVRNQSS